MSTDERLLSKPELPPSFPIIWKDSIIYEHARVGRVFNHRRPTRYPLAVVEATTEDHIVEAVRLANQLGCRVSVRSGGHSWAAWSVRDDAILIDLGKFFHFHLHNETGVLEASPSMTGRTVNKLLDPHSRMFPGGHCPDVALGGFLLQGGMGWNCKVRISGIPTERLELIIFGTGVFHVNGC
jgi:FAD/FMN-containing dehydrogenase